MRTLPPTYLANFDSASSFLRATARYLMGKDFPSWGLARPIKKIVPLANLLGRETREMIYAVGGMTEAISPGRTDKIDAEQIARWATELYPARKYPAVMIGSSSGALVHLCAALGMPWLPQTVFIPVRQTDVHVDEPKDAMEAGREPGRRLLEANPELQLHHMHDPNQDRLMLQYMTYFRIKWLQLAEAHKAFLHQSLHPGGLIILVECRRSWPSTRLSDRHVFQFGALGGATPEEFLHGSERVEHYLEKYGSHRRRWDAPAPNEDTPEAEWGFEPRLGEDVERFAREHGYRVARLIFDEPEDLSTPVADLYRWWYRQRRIRANRLFVESFIMIEPWWVLRTGSVPFWLKFNMEPSLEALERYLDGAPPYDEIYLTLFQHGVEAVGLPRIEDWHRPLGRARRRSALLGIDPELHPRDFGGLGSYQDAIRKIRARYPLPGPLTLDQFTRFLEENKGRYPVQWRGPDHHTRLHLAA